MSSQDGGLFDAGIVLECGGTGKVKTLAIHQLVVSDVGTLVIIVPLKVQLLNRILLNVELLV